MAARIGLDFERNVFINCPFDAAYAPMFEAIVFAVKDAGFEPRSAREKLDSSQVRLHATQVRDALTCGVWLRSHTLRRGTSSSRRPVHRSVSTLLALVLADAAV